jgi:hypothetical protein
VEPVFDTPEYPAEQRKQMFRAVQESKSRIQDRSLRLVQNSLRTAPGRPLVLIRSSRRDNIFPLFKDIRPGNPHIILYKGSGEFLNHLDPGVRDSYATVQVAGQGLLAAADAAGLDLVRLRGGVVVFDVPNGNLAKSQNLLEFARALAPRQIVALLGDRFEILRVRPGKELRLEDPEMEPAYLGIDPGRVAAAGALTDCRRGL